MTNSEGWAFLMAHAERRVLRVNVPEYPEERDLIVGYFHGASCLLSPAPGLLGLVGREVAENLTSETLWQNGIRWTHDPVQALRQIGLL